jgi:hypothetical protein
LAANTGFVFKSSQPDNPGSKKPALLSFVDIQMTDRQNVVIQMADSQNVDI